MSSNLSLISMYLMLLLIHSNNELIKIAQELLNDIGYFFIVNCTIFVPASFPSTMW